SVLGCPCYPLERLLPKLRVHHRPANIPPQPPDIAHAHRAENLDQLIMPDTKQVHKTLRTPCRVNPSRPQLVAVPISSLAEKLRLQSNENRCINPDEIRAAYDRLRNVLREGYPTTRDNRHLVPESLFHELLVDLFQRGRDVLRILRVILTMIISVQVQSVHSLSCQLARNR